MKKYVSLVCALAFICAFSVAFACGTYILIPDSDTRPLFEDEVRGYSADTLGYVFNEILARHGYHFEPDSEYDQHFRNISYLYPHDSGFPYQEAPADVSNESIMANLSAIEKGNLDLIERIWAEKRETHDGYGFLATWCCSETPEGLEFDPVGYSSIRLSLPINLDIPVYSGPGEHYLRADNASASVSTNKDIFAYGFDGDWLMITYFADPEIGKARVGYIHKDSFGRDLNPAACAPLAPDSDDEEESLCDTHYALITQLDFQPEPITLTTGVTLTDDPCGTANPLVHLKAGETVSFLRAYPADDELDEDESQWYYVEYAAQTPVRGFVPSELLK